MKVEDKVAAAIEQLLGCNRAVGDADAELICAVSRKTDATKHLVAVIKSTGKPWILYRGNQYKVDDNGIDLVTIEFNGLVIPDNTGHETEGEHDNE